MPKCSAPPWANGCGWPTPSVPVKSRPTTPCAQAATAKKVKFGGGKTIRDGMAQSQRTPRRGAVDTVLTNAPVIDHTGIFKADTSACKAGRIAAIGKAGNPDTQSWRGHHHRPGTEVIISCEGNIVTAGGFDSHIHFIAPADRRRGPDRQRDHHAGGGTGPAWHAGHHLHVGVFNMGAHAAGGRCLPYEPGLAWQGQRQ